MSDHQYAEAFNLMHYACKNCKHREVIWNSRNGVTPFGLTCPSCGKHDLLHVEWHRDVKAPDHVPHPGQRVFIDMTIEKARLYAERLLASFALAGHDVSHIDREQYAVDMVAPHGDPSPDVAIAGIDYEPKP